MARSLDITVPAEKRSALLGRLEKLEQVAAILVHRGASHRPPGDLVVVHGTNSAIEAAARAAVDLGLEDGGTLSIGEPVALTAHGRRQSVENESNDASWEEIDTLLRRDTNPGHNFLALMFLSGGVAGAGLMLDTLHIVIGAMLIAPAFEPLVRIAMGVAAGLGDTARRGLVSTLAGYLLMAAGGALGMALAAWADPATRIDDLAQRDWLQYWSEVSWTGVLLSLLAGIAGAVVINAHQNVQATGVMVALALVPAAAICGMGLAAGEPGLALGALARWATDLVCVVMASLAVFALKRMLTGRGAVA